MIERLGAGGMGEVFLASLERADGFKKLLVIKRILPEFSESTRFREMFSAEARIAARLNHPGIIQVTDFGYIGRNCYLAMEHVDGCDLAALLEGAQRQCLRIPLDLVAAVGLSCLRALGYAHRANPAVIHGDVSPANILLGREGQVKLTDFGLARLAGGRRGSAGAGEIRGKLGYMPPEVAFGRAPQAASDLFGLGAVLYELVAGVGPLPRVSGLDEALAQARRCQIPPLGELRPDTDPALAQLIDRSLRPAVDDRHTDAADMEAALQEAADRLGLDSGPASVASVVTRVVRSKSSRTRDVPRTLVAQLAAPRRKSLYGKIGLLLVIVAAVITGGLLWYLLRAPPEIIQPSTPEHEQIAAEPAIGPDGALDAADAGIQDSPDAGRKGRHRKPRHKVGGLIADAGIEDRGGSPPADAVTNMFLLTANRQVSVFIDGKPQGHSPYRSGQAFTGTHIVKLVDPEGIAATIRVERAGDTSDVVFAFRSQPFAILSIDDNPKGLTPIGNVHLERGLHLFTLAASDQRPLMLRITVP